MEWSPVDGHFFMNSEPLIPMSLLQKEDYKTMPRSSIIKFVLYKLSKKIEKKINIKLSDTLYRLVKKLETQESAFTDQTPSTPGGDYLLQDMLRRKNQLMKTNPQFNSLSSSILSSPMRSSGIDCDHHDDVDSIKTQYDSEDSDYQKLEIFDTSYHLSWDENAAPSVFLNIFMSSIVLGPKSIQIDDLYSQWTKFLNVFKKKPDENNCSVEEVFNEIDIEKLESEIINSIEKIATDSHDMFQSKLTKVEEIYLKKLSKLEKTRKSVCKEAAPKVARLALESRAFLDMLCNGMPNLEREIGRGKFFNFFVPNQF